MFDTQCHLPLWSTDIQIGWVFFRRRECCPTLTHCIKHGEGFYVQRKPYHCSLWLSAITYEARWKGVDSVLPNRSCISYYPLDCQLIGNKDIKQVPYQPNPAHTSMTYFPCQTGHIFVDWVLVLCLNECKKLPLKKSGNCEFFCFCNIAVGRVDDHLSSQKPLMKLEKARQEEQIRLVPLLCRSPFGCWLMGLTKIKPTVSKLCKYCKCSNIF